METGRGSSVACRCPLAPMWPLGQNGALAVGGFLCSLHVQPGELEKMEMLRGFALLSCWDWDSDKHRCVFMCTVWDCCI